MLIKATHLSKTYQMGPTFVHALRGVDFEVAHGEFVAIMGTSGSGKSTLLQLLGCLDRPSAGQYSLDGIAVESLTDTELSKLRNKLIGFVFQSFHLILQQSILENVELPLIYQGIEKNSRREKSLDILSRVGLKEKIRHRPTELSGGQNQRVAIARALAVGPVLILADEPTGNLDSETGKEIMKLFTNLNEQGVSLVLVTHDDEIASYAKRVIVMRDGKVLSDRKKMKG